MKKLILILSLVGIINAESYKPTQDDLNFITICNGIKEGQEYKQFITTQSIKNSFMLMIGITEGALKMADEYPNILNRDRFKDIGALMEPICFTTALIFNDLEKEVGHSLSFKEAYKTGVTVALKKSKK